MRSASTGRFRWASTRGGPSPWRARSSPCSSGRSSSSPSRWSNRAVGPGGTIHDTPMKALGIPIGIAAALVAPFVALQLINRRLLHEDFPYVLFAFMSVMALGIVFLLRPAVRHLRTQGSLKALTPGHWAGVLVAGVLVVAYVGGVIDQLPCFMGVDRKSTRLNSSHLGIS